MTRTMTMMAVALTLIISMPAQAGWKLLPAGRPEAVGKLIITPMTDWNRASAKPGKQGVTWTHDGFALNKLEAFAAVPDGGTIYKDRAKKQNPMPKYSKEMLLPDLAEFFERSFRVQNDVSNFMVEETAPIQWTENSAIRVRYSYSLPGDDLSRRGEAVMMNLKEGLYLLNFEAPSLHYFEAGLPEFQGMVDRTAYK